MKIWLVGAGPMAALHAPVLEEMGHEVTVIATSPTRAEPLAAAHGMMAFLHGLDAGLTDLPLPDAAIVVLPVDLLAEAALKLVQGGVPRILIEKPGCLNTRELDLVVEAAKSRGTYVGIAYNRRFFAATIEARRRIAEAGKCLSVVFDFTEAADRIAALPTPAAIKNRWVLANSSHVIDLAFHLAGRPAELKTHIRGGFDWHPTGSDFRGLGMTETGASFSYHADWRGPGRWGIEIVLPTERLVLRPMEQLQVMPHGSFNLQQVQIDDTLDHRFKPGLYRQMAGFLADHPDPLLVTAEQQLTAIRSVYNRIAGYDEE